MKKHIIFDLDGTLYDPYKTNSMYHDAHPTVTQLSMMAHLSMVTAGDYTSQWAKIRKTCLGTFFEPIQVVSEKKAKYGAFELFLPGSGIVPPSLRPQDIIVVGDRVEFEIAFGSILGFTTVRILRGPHQNRQPQSIFEKAQHEIVRLNELIPLVRNGHS